MKKVYTKPNAEKIEFNYVEQIVAASGSRPVGTHFMDGYGNCDCGAEGSDVGNV